MCAYKVKVVKRGRMKISNLYLGRGSAGASLSTPAKLFSTPAELGARRGSAGTRLSTPAELFSTLAKLEPFIRYQDKIKQQANKTKQRILREPGRNTYYSTSKLRVSYNKEARCVFLLYLVL